MRTTDNVLHLPNRSSSANTIADILKRTPTHSIDNVLIEALRLYGADTKVYSELAVKAKKIILNSRARYVLINKDMIQ